VTARSIMGMDESWIVRAFSVAGATVSLVAEIPSGPAGADLLSYSTLVRVCQRVKRLSLEKSPLT
jgi:hypothetical protein